MLNTRRRRLCHQGEAAIQRLAEIEASIVTLGNEDLLDLADIYKAEPHTSLAKIAFAELARRGISL
jgi:hypothetical protein